MKIKPWLPMALALMVAARFAGEAMGAPPSAPEQERQESLAALTKIAGSYRIMVNGKRIATLQEKSAIRWNKTVSEVEDAALFLWMDDGRPVVAGTMLWQRNVGLYHEFQSLTADSIKAVRDNEEVWMTTKPGIAFAPVPDAPVPAGTANSRLVQMNALAKEFRAEAIKGVPFYPENSVYKFRLLPKPLLRYADPQRPEREGAVFAFVQGTDPEALLLLESRPHGDGLRWEYAMAPMTGWKLQGWHKERKVWSIGRRHPGSDPTQPYFVAGPFPRKGEP